MVPRLLPPASSFTPTSPLLSSLITAEAHDAPILQQTPPQLAARLSLGCGHPAPWWRSVALLEEGKGGAVVDPGSGGARRLRGLRSSLRQGKHTGRSQRGPLSCGVGLTFYGPPLPFARDAETNHEASEEKALAYSQNRKNQDP